TVCPADSWADAAPSEAAWPASVIASDVDWPASLAASETAAPPDSMAPPTSSPVCCPQPVIHTPRLNMVIAIGAFMSLYLSGDFREQLETGPPSSASTEPERA